MSVYSDKEKIRLGVSPIDRRAVIRKILADKKITVSRWSQRAGIGNSLYNFLNGQTDSLTQGTLEKLADAIDMSVGDLTGSPIVRPGVQAGSITVRGDLSAGTWRDAAEWTTSGKFNVDLPVPARWRGTAYGLRISGRSMNKKWPDGAIVVCVPFADYGFSLKSGEDYVVVHRRNSLGLIEATIKRYEEHDDEIWLCTETDDEEEIETIKLPIDDRELEKPPIRESGEEAQPPVNQIYIVAVVLGGYISTHAGRF